jgi:hypothetical protein
MTEIAGFTANLCADILSEISPIFQEISAKTLVVVYDEWITRLEWTTERIGEYCHTEYKKSNAL